MSATLGKTILGVALATTLLSEPARAADVRAHLEGGGAHFLGLAGAWQGREIGTGAIGSGALELLASRRFGIEGRLVAGSFTQGAAPSDAKYQRVDQTSLYGATAGLRWQPLWDDRGLWFSGGVGAVRTGSLTREALDARIGWDFRLFGITRGGPFLGYMQVLQPDSSLRPEDARLATLGFHVAFDEVEPLRAAPPKPADTYVAPKKPEKKVEPVAPPPPPPPEVAPVAVDEAVVVGDTIVLGSKIFFEYASANIGSDSATLIENIARCILGHPEIELLEIDGHTDDIGGEKWNLELSEARANAVRDALIAKGVSAARLTTRGFGLSRPLVVGFDEASRAKNRRVELIIVRKAEQ